MKLKGYLNIIILALLGVLVLTAIIRNQSYQSGCTIKQVKARKVENATTGIQDLWALHFNIDFTATDSLVAYDDLFLVATSCGEVLALDSVTGELVWESGDLRNPWNIVIDSDRKLLYVSGQGELRALSLKCCIRQVN